MSTNSSRQRPNTRAAGTESIRMQRSVQGSLSADIAVNSIGRGKKRVAKQGGCQPKAPVPQKTKKPCRSKIKQKLEYLPPAISDSESPTSEDDQPPPPKKVKRTKSKAKGPAVRLEVEENDSDSSAEINHNEEDEDDPASDVNATHYLDAESVQFTTANSQHTVNQSSQTSSRVSQKSNLRYTQRVPPATPTYEEEDAVNDRFTEIPSHEEAISEDEGEEQVTARKISCYKAQKLQYELPQVNSKLLPAAGQHTSSDIEWLEHTNITVNSKVRSFTLGMTGQPPVMRKVIEEAIAYGKLQMLFNHEFSPVSATAVKQLAHASLMEIAERKGYTGERDICDRLERGDMTSYIKPLCDYVSGRVVSERTDLKNPHAVVLRAFGFTSTTGRVEAGDIACMRTYYYPNSSNGSPDYRKPFEHPVFVDFIREAFFSTSYYSNIIKAHHHLFASSIEEKPEEIEVTKGMVALAAVAVHACLEDHAAGVKHHFPTAALDGVWRVTLNILKGLEQKSHRKYHKLMNKLFTESTGDLMLARHGYTNQQIYDLVDWDAINDEESDTENSAPVTRLDNINMESPAGSSATASISM
ncbi:hypothetical protein F5877DRAFT_74137 [Lentinula edodes]|nr:hypothetical protein F5877DRAFT_74137 [Lentinula edodes]